MKAINFLDHPLVIVFVAVLSWPVYKVLAKIFFGEYYQNFGESIHYLLQWDVKSFFKGEYLKDLEAEWLLKVYILVCLAWIAAASELICRCLY